MMSEELFEQAKWAPVAAGRGQSKVRPVDTKPQAPVKHCGYPTQIVKLENALFLLSFRTLAGRDSKGKAPTAAGSSGWWDSRFCAARFSLPQMARDLRYRSAIALPTWLDPLE